jgi:hypothetical protein
MEPPILSDKSQYPSEEIIFSHLGITKALWLSLFEHIHLSHPAFTKEWRFYNDGKSWLLKVSQKKKTIFWLSIIKGSFRTTFYFTDKAEKVIMASDISDELKEQFKDGKRYNRIRGLTIYYKNKSDIEAAKILMGIKALLK